MRCPLSGSRPGERREIRRLEVLETSNDQARLDDALAVDDLPLQHPTRTYDILCQSSIHALECARRVPTRHFVEHGLLGKFCVALSLLKSEDVVLALDHCGFVATAIHSENVELTLLQLGPEFFGDSVELGYLRGHLELDELVRVSVGAVSGAGRCDHRARARACGRPDWSAAKVGKLGLLKWCGDINLVDIFCDALILAMSLEVSLAILLQVCCKV